LTYLLNWKICSTVGRTTNLPIRAIGDLLWTHCSIVRIGDRKRGENGQVWTVVDKATGKFWQLGWLVGHLARW
jgi:hypothetical protein